MPKKPIDWETNERCSTGIRETIYSALLKYVRTTMFPSSEPSMPKAYPYVANSPIVGYNGHERVVPLSNHVATDLYNDSSYQAESRRRYDAYWETYARQTCQPTSGMNVLTLDGPVYNTASDRASSSSYKMPSRDSTISDDDVVDVTWQRHAEREMNCVHGFFVPLQYRQQPFHATSISTFDSSYDRDLQILCDKGIFSTMDADPNNCRPLSFTTVLPPELPPATYDNNTEAYQHFDFVSTRHARAIERSHPDELLESTVFFENDTVEAYRNSPQVWQDLCSSVMEQRESNFDDVIRKIYSDFHTDEDVSRWTPFSESLPFQDDFFGPPPTPRSTSTPPERRLSSSASVCSRSPSPVVLNDSSSPDVIVLDDSPLPNPMSPIVLSDSPSPSPCTSHLTVSIDSSSQNSSVSSNSRSPTPDSSPNQEDLDFHLDEKLVPSQPEEAFDPVAVDKKREPRGRRGRQSRDDHFVEKYSLPVSADRLANMSHNELQALLRDPSLTGLQREMIKKVRRRGRNRVAAQRCRQRRLSKVLVD